MSITSEPSSCMATGSLCCTPSHGGCCSVQGGRSYNEDRHVVIERFLKIADSFQKEAWLQLFGVFDGHGGSKVSEFCASGIPDLLRGLLSSFSKLECLLSENTETHVMNTVIEHVAACLANTFLSVDKALSEHVELSKEAQLMGTTAVAALLCRQHVWVANCGDSRAVVCCGGVAKPLTSDHKASCPREAARIVKAGGAIFNNGGARLMGILAVTRAIGDHALHPHGLIPMPDVTYYQRSSSDQFLILASDGLWDVLSDQDAADLVSRVFARAQGHSSRVKRSSIPNIAASVLTRVAIARGSQDNVTATVIDLRPPSSMQKQVHAVAVAAGRSPLETPTFYEGKVHGSEYNVVPSSDPLSTSDMISDELKSASNSVADVRADAKHVARPDGRTPFAELDNTRKRSVEDFAQEPLCDHKKPQKRALSMAPRRLNPAGCSGEMHSDMQQYSGFMSGGLPAPCF